MCPTLVSYRRNIQGTTFTCRSAGISCRDAYNYRPVLLAFWQVTPSKVRHQQTQSSTTSTTLRD
ncbi:unnamed protein product [Timema podura]|uniref:Uncharacterized protein n=1 Tax=Timema podura TaxID=61482 RepID=A0ABN7PEP6_TIMPD|nr:unnamed protein product [Timema podura]